MSLLRRLAGRLLPAAAHDAGRWVVLDVESSGLNPTADRLLAIAAIAVRTDGGQPRIALGDSFEVVLRHDVSVADSTAACAVVMLGSWVAVRAPTCSALSLVTWVVVKAAIWSVVRLAMCSVVSV